MAKVSLDLIQKLREQTGVGMMDCRKALTEADGDIDEAVSLLRKKGVSVAAKRADNATECGLVDGFASDDYASISEISCETDFSARNEVMREFASKVCKTAASDIDLSNLENLLGATVKATGLTLKTSLDELISKVCENIKLNAALSFKFAKNSAGNVYVHPDHSVVAMVEISADSEISDTQRRALADFAREIGMQIAVNKPLAIRPEELDSKLVENEKDIARTQLAQTTKPEKMWDMIIEGKIKKFYEDVCLLNQKFIKDDSVTIQKKLDVLAKELGLGSLTVSRFSRIGIGR